MIEISLLPVDEQAELKASQKGLGFEIPKFIPRGFGIAIVLLLLLYVISSLRVSAVSKTLLSSRQTLDDLQKASLQAQLITAKLGPEPGNPGTTERTSATPEAPIDSGERLRKRADVFRTRLENRKVWSQILLEITLTCPEEIRLTEIKLVPLRTGTTSHEAKELLISGYYETGGNLEMTFAERLRTNKIITAHYKNFMATTQPETERILFWIHCREQ